jgi:hypothetical protein
MIVHLVFQRRLPNLIQSRKLVQIDRITVRHDEAVKDDSKPVLAESVHFLGLSENLGSCRNE